jgi:hypothetical protein
LQSLICPTTTRSSPSLPNHVVMDSRKNWAMNPAPHIITDFAIPVEFTSEKSAQVN